MFRNKIIKWHVVIACNIIYVYFSLSRVKIEGDSVFRYLPARSPPLSCHE